MKYVASRLEVGSAGTGGLRHTLARNKTSCLSLTHICIGKYKCEAKQCLSQNEVSGRFPATHLEEVQRLRHPMIGGETLSQGGSASGHQA